MAVQRGKGKVGRKSSKEPWALHDIEAGRTKQDNLDEAHPDLLETLSALYDL